MDENNKTIVIGEHKYPFKVPLSLIQLSKYLEYFLPNSKRELKDIFVKLGLDSASRRKLNNTIVFKTDAGERMKLLNINKALTMELFASGMISYFDHPPEVQSNCVVNRSLDHETAEDNQISAMPNNFAPGGVPDVLVNYGDFSVVLEVSAKSMPSLNHYKDQLNGALKHARTIRENGYDKPLYCLVIHERSLQLTDNRNALKEVLDQIDPSEQINIIATSIQEFAELGQEMAGEYEYYISKVSSDDLHNVLKASAEKGIFGQFKEEFLSYLDNLESKDNPLLF